MKYIIVLALVLMLLIYIPTNEDFSNPSIYTLEVNEAYEALAPILDHNNLSSNKPTKEKEKEAANIHLLYELVERHALDDDDGQERLLKLDDKPGALAFNATIKRSPSGQFINPIGSRLDFEGTIGKTAKNNTVYVNVLDMRVLLSTDKPIAILSDRIAGEEMLFDSTADEVVITFMPEISGIDGKPLPVSPPSVVDGIGEALDGIKKVTSKMVNGVKIYVWEEMELASEEAVQRRLKPTPKMEYNGFYATMQTTESVKNEKVKAHFLKYDGGQEFKNSYVLGSAKEGWTLVAFNKSEPSQGMVVAVNMTKKPRSRGINGYSTGEEMHSSWEKGSPRTIDYYYVPEETFLVFDSVVNGAKDSTAKLRKELGLEDGEKFSSYEWLCDSVDGAQKLRRAKTVIGWLI